MLRAVPITVRTAESRLVVFKSDKLDLGDLFDLLARHFADFVAIGFGGTLDDAGGALQQARKPEASW